MKLRYFFLFSLLVTELMIPMRSAAQSWNEVAHIGGMGRVSSCYFFNASTGLIGFDDVSNGSPILRTTDGGTTWQSVTTPIISDSWACDIWFKDSLNGWATFLNGDIGFLWHSTDGGLSWSSVSLEGMFTGVRATSKAVVVAQLEQGIGIFISTDGGSTFPATYGESQNGVDFVDDLHGASGSYNHYAGFAYTGDGGLTWQPATGPDDEAWGVYGMRGTSIFLASGEIAGEILRSTDFGQNWNVTTSLEVNGAISGANGAMYVQGESGLYRTLDSGMTWTNIGGPVNEVDCRIAALSCVIFAFDADGGIWKYTSAQSSSLSPILFVPLQTSILNQSLCNTPVDTSISLGIVGCGTLSGTLDSLWLTGSTAFQIADARTAPRMLGTVDSILVHYDGKQGPDTSILHLQYNLGSGLKDTTIQLVGTPAFASQTAQIHRASASGYFGQIDSPTLEVDLSSQINIDSLWHHITDIQATYSWDSSVVRYDAYFAPSGWSLVALSSSKNSVSFEIQNIASSPTQPLNLGTALFLPISTQLATAWVELPSLTIDIGSEQLLLCVTDNEDNHWAVKTLGVQSGVTEVPVPSQDISIYPNPAGEELFVQNSNEFPLSVEIYDAIGREVLSATGVPAATTTLATQPLQDGVYFFRATGANGFSTSSKVVIVR